MPNLYDSPINIYQTNSRSLAPYNNPGCSHSVVMDQNGDLYAAHSLGAGLVVKKSTDNGYSWTQIGSATYNPDLTSSGTFLTGDWGAPLDIRTDSQGVIWVTRMAGNNPNETLKIYGISKDLSADEDYNFWNETLGPDYGAGSEFQEQFGHGMFHVAGSADTYMYIIGLDGSTHTLKAIPIDMNHYTLTPWPYAPITHGSLSGAGDEGVSIDSCEVSGVIKVVVSEQQSNEAHTRAVKVTNLNTSTNTWSADYEPAIASGSLADNSYYASVGIAYDGYKSCVVAQEMNAARTSGLLVYSVNNTGVEWNGSDTYAIASGIPNPTATSPYVPDVVNASGVQLCPRIIGIDGGGFYVSSIFITDSSGLPEVYVNKITKTGEVYAPGTWQTAASNTSRGISTSEFFRNSNSVTPAPFRVKDTRLAYFTGTDGIDASGNGAVGGIFQEHITNEAYTSEGHNVPESIDFYASGYTGDFTTKYETIFTNASTIDFKKWEPDEDAVVNGISAYTESGSYVSGSGAVSTSMYIHPISFQFPTVDNATSTSQAAVEKDVRKIFIKPNAFLERSYILNNGGFLKRTVWTFAYNGVEYEASQIVPRFIDNQIVYWEANAYLIGVSYNPWEKLTLPGEA